MTMQMPEAIEIPRPSLAEQLGTGLGAGLQTGIQNLLQQRQQQRQAGALGQVLGLEGPKAEAFSKLSPAGQELFVKQQMEDQKRLQQLAAQKQRTEEAEKVALGKEKIKSEWASPEIKKYRENLGLREDTATQLQPALVNARQYEKDPTRFVKGTAASKSLGDLATRAFAFYKPLFGGRLTQREFVSSMANLSADRTFPGGFNQALNLIESMITQATTEGDLFNDYLEQGFSPQQARRHTLKSMQEKANEITSILKGEQVTAPTQKKTYESLSEIKEMPIGTRATNKKTGQQAEWTGETWRLIK